MMRRIGFIAAVLVVVGCSETVELGASAVDRDASGIDGTSGGACSPSGTQCNNCIDDDRDGLTDGFDPECTSAADDDESSFATGIPGDNRDLVQQDCFFDGDSGSGNDGCSLHICCLLEICPPDLPGGAFDPVADCPAVSDTCVDYCQPITPPGCDCFGCCTVCSGDDCFDIMLHPQVAPGCDQDTVADPVACPRCVKSDACSSSSCDLDDCVLCPGQTLEDLPPNCQSADCGGGQTCTTSSECGPGQYCSVGCCIDTVL